ncbi:type II toxin-antitoxin system PrlF family antitoxin [Pseudomonas arsenicoxydans]|uniref:type II toxin-antitoxin system PrlF family antitoxin n=1 Tax=Pseudomonas arsenicoxydans TaxID=702115 RepID=UPI0018D489DE|nr:type II toxin-antitoxin system PrlF family antitoxin [Pseudomonas arsenicoxydans]
MESSESDSMVLRILGLLAADIDEHPGRLKAVDSELLARINSLVGDVQIDLTEPLCRDDE